MNQQSALKQSFLFVEEFIRDSSELTCCWNVDMCSRNNLTLHQSDQIMFLGLLSLDYSQWNDRRQKTYKKYKQCNLRKNRQVLQDFTGGSCSVSLQLLCQRNVNSKSVVPLFLWRNQQVLAEDASYFYLLRVKSFGGDNHVAVATTACDL